MPAARHDRAVEFDRKPLACEPEVADESADRRAGRDGCMLAIDCDCGVHLPRIIPGLASVAGSRQTVVMSTVLRASLALALALYTAAGHGAPSDPLPSHPELVSGVLENGVRYLVKPHAQPPGRVSLRLYLPVGSLNETDDQHGYAHLVEHLAFAGSTSFPSGRAIPHFEALGMTLGRHQNGYTAIDQTVYSLDLPAASDRVVGDGLTFLADVLGRLEFTDERIEQEQGVVLAEMQTYLGPQQRLMDRWFRRVARGARAVERPVLGDGESIEAAEKASAEEFYRRWYTTKSATVILVGDIEVERARTLIEAAFASLPAAPVRKPEHAGTIAHEKAFAQVITDPDIAGAQITLLHVGPLRPPSTTDADFRRDLVDALAETALNRRLENRIAGGQAAFRGGGAWTDTFFSAGWSIGASAFGEPAQWRALLSELAAELQAFQAGVGEHELERTKAAVRASVSQYAELDHTLPGAEIAQSVLVAVHAREPWLSGAQLQAFVERHIDSIEPDEVSAVFRDFDPARMSVTLTMATGEQAPAEADLLEAAVDAFAKEAVARVDMAAPVALPEFTATAGTVVAADTDADTGVHSVWLSNGVRVHHRYMDRRPHSVAVFATLAGGPIEETDATRAHTLAATGTLQRLATRRMSSSDLRSLLFARSLSLQTFLADDAVTVGMDATLDEFELGLQLLHATLTEPYLEPVSFAQWQQGMLDGLREGARNPAISLYRGLALARYPADDPRWRPIAAAEVERLELDSVQAWFDAFVRRAPLEVAIVGDISREDALALAERYLGSLPARARISPELFDRAVERPEYPIETAERIASATPQAAVLVGFAGADDAAVDDQRALRQAARVLTIRMNRRIREQEGLVYSITALHETGALQGFSTFSASATVAPDNAKRLERMISEMFAEFAKEGPDDDEVAVAYRQFETGFAEDLQEPFFWANRYARATYDAGPVSSPQALMDAYRALTREQIRAVFAHYHDAGTRIRYIVLPAESP